MTNSTRSRWMKPLLALAVVLALPFPAFSWGAGGHMMTARIAYTRLNRNARAQVDRLVKIRINPAGITANSLNFISASHWADDLRPVSEFDFLEPLHFVTQTFTTDGTPLPQNLPAENILTALNHYVDVLKNSTNDEERAQALRLIIHFVGDIHQPLHCATRFSRAHLEGDRGGNLFSIRIRGKNGRLQKSNLHSYWDGGIGTFPPTGPNFAPPPMRLIPPAAARIARKFPATNDAWRAGGPLGFDQWATESKELAMGTAHRNIREKQVPSRRYNQAALRVAERRVAWGGYRLAALLNSIWPVE